MNELILLGNISLYAGMLFYIYMNKKNTGEALCLLFVGLFVISAFCSYMYYDSSLYHSLSEKRSEELSVIALLYLFLGFIIYCKPFLSFNINAPIVFPKIGRTDVFYWGFVYLGILSILPVIENLVSLSNMGASDFADVYYEKMEDDYDARKQFSAFGRICNGFTGWFQYISPIGFFYMIVNKKKWYWILLSFLAMINPVLGSMNQGGRGPLFQVVCILAFNYMLFRNYFSYKVQKKIQFYALIVLSTFAALLVFITFARAEGDNDFAISQIYRYLGEGFVNFSETGWFIFNHTLGHSCINGTGHTFFNDISTYFEPRDYLGLSEFTKIRMYVYYTVFGDYFIDFGIIGGILFNILIAASFYHFVKGRCNNISSIIMANLYAKIGFNGIYCFAYMARFEYMFFTIVCALIIRHFEKGNVKSLRLQ